MQEQIRQKYKFYNFAKHQNINLYSEKNIRITFCKEDKLKD